MPGTCYPILAGVQPFALFWGSGLASVPLDLVWIRLDPVFNRCRHRCSKKRTHNMESTTWKIEKGGK